MVPSRHEGVFDKDASFHPYLFIMRCELLSTLLQDAEAQKEFKFPWPADQLSPTISHLMFTDGLIIVGETSVRNLDITSSVLNSRKRSVAGKCR